jgi:hypothetical protein
MLHLKDVRTEYNFTIKRNTVPFDGIMRGLERNDYSFDFDVFLPSKGFNLQRDFCWILYQKQQLILSILRENPIPKVSVIKSTSKDGIEVYKVIDGKQRISTYIDFCRNLFPIVVDNKEYYYNDCDDMVKYHIDRFDFPGDLAYEYWDHPISDDDKIKWFIQVNFAGTQQELEHFAKLKNV